MFGLPLPGLPSSEPRGPPPIVLWVEFHQLVILLNALKPRKNDGFQPENWEFQRPNVVFSLWSSPNGTNYNHKSRLGLKDASLFESSNSHM